MRPYQTSFAGYAAADTDSICLTQTPLAAGNLTINGALASGGVATLSPAGFVTVKCAGNDAGRTFTIYGTSPEGWSQTSTIAGANIGTTTGAYSYKTVTRVAVDDATAGAIEVGTAQAGYTEWMPLDIMVPNQVTTISTNITGTLNYSWQFTNDNIWGEAPTFVVDPSTIIAFSHPVAGLVTASSDQYGSTTVLMRAVRFLANSGSGTAKNVVTQQSTQ